jgi:2-keto-4-pentenoate hydratase/2-oxohepta-3-ene-1,7-dioic acid hydratase in catechol pathway
LEELGKPVDDLAFTLHNHDQLVQSGNSSDMLFTVDRLIAEVSTFMTLKMGDLIFTGTPAGVAAVQPGDRLSGQLEGREMFAVNVK